MDITIRPLDQNDLPEADRIFRLAFRQSSPGKRAKSESFEQSGSVFESMHCENRIRNKPSGPHGWLEKFHDADEVIRSRNQDSGMG